MRDGMAGYKYEAKWGLAGAALAFRLGPWWACRSLCRVHTVVSLRPAPAHILLSG